MHVLSREHPSYTCGLGLVLNSVAFRCEFVLDSTIIFDKYSTKSRKVQKVSAATVNEDQINQLTKHKHPQQSI